MAPWLPDLVHLSCPSYGWLVGFPHKTNWLHYHNHHSVEQLPQRLATPASGQTPRTQSKLASTSIADFGPAMDHPRTQHPRDIPLSDLAGTPSIALASAGSIVIPRPRLGPRRCRLLRQRRRPGQRCLGRRRGPQRRCAGLGRSGGVGGVASEESASGGGGYLSPS